MWRIKEEAKVEAIFTTISKFWSVHPSYIEAGSCSMLGRDDISVLHHLSTCASIPLHGFSVADEAAAALDSIEIDDDVTERQPLLVAVRGAGGGKSRAIELLVAELNNRALSASIGDPPADPGVLGIAITFNHSWTTLLANLKGIAQDDPEHHMAIEVASRVLSVLYGEDMAVVQKAMKEHASIFLDAPSKDVVRAVLAHAARRVGDARGQPVTRLMLCIDEAKRGVTGVFGDSAVLKKEALDSFNCVYSPATILPIIVPGGPDINLVDCGIYLTSLVTLPTTSTGRTIERRALSDITRADACDGWMNDTEIPQSWKNTDDDTIAVRELLGAIAAPLPRVLEYITVELRKGTGATVSGNARERTMAVLDSVLMRVQRQYQRAVLPPPPLLFDAVYRNAVDEFDDATRAAVENSVFTNRFSSELFVRADWVLPEPSLVMMLAAATKTKASATQAALVIRRARDVLKYVLEPALGEPLEHLMYEAIALRIAVAVDKKQVRKLGLGALFNVEEDLEDLNALGNLSILQATLSVDRRQELVLHYDPSVVGAGLGDSDRLPSSGRGQPKDVAIGISLLEIFFKHIGLLDVGNKIHIIRSAAGEAFDIAIISSHGVTLVDTKSGKAAVLDEGEDYPMELPEGSKPFFRQAEYAANELVPAARAYLDSGGVDPHGTVKKFAAGDSDYVFLQAGSSGYLSTPIITYGGESGDERFTIKPRSMDDGVEAADSRPFTPRVCLVCEGPVSDPHAGVRGMLGMYYPYYQVMRASWWKAQRVKNASAGEQAV